MKFISLYAGIEGIGYGFEKAGMECVAQVENDKYCNSVRMRHYPHVKQYGDIRDVKGSGLPKADVLVGGFPCQDLSVAGKRSGLGGSRSSLWWQYARLIEEIEPTWFLVENVPGLLSSGKGRDMGILLGKMAELGYWWSYRVLDAQYYGVAQRRRRVFIVGHASSLASAVKVLFESESCDWDTKPSREEREGNSRGAGESVVDFGRTGDRIRIDSDVSATPQGEGGGMGAKTGLYAFSAGNSAKSRNIAGDYEISPPLKGEASGTNQVPTIMLPNIARSLTTREGKRHDQSLETYIIQTAHTGANQNNVKESRVSETLDGANSQVIAFEHRRTNMNEQEDLSPTLNPGGGGSQSPAICFQQNTRDEVRKIGGEGEIAGALSAQPGAKQQNYICEDTQYYIRKLTPLECERLQGFPDYWTKYGKDGEEISDTQRYKMLGNAVATTVSEWIGKRMMDVHNS